MQENNPAIKISYKLFKKFRGSDCGKGEII